MAKSTSPAPGRVAAGSGREEPSLYDRIGGEQVVRLVAAFYARVDRDPVIRPLYGKTLTCAIHGLTDFLTSFLGGPSVYDVPGARLRRRHVPFAIDARARDAWLANMRSAVREVGIPDPEARVLLAHLEFGARSLVNTGAKPERAPCPAEVAPFDPRLAERWNRLAAAEDVYEAVSRGDLALLGEMLPKRLVPHAVLMCHALAGSLDPLGRADPRYGRRPKGVNPLEVIELLLAHRELDVDPAEGDELARFLHLQAMIQAYAGVSHMLRAGSPLRAAVRAATRDRFVGRVESDPSCARLLGPRGQTLLHEAVTAGEAELAAVLIRSGADPDAKETEGHTPLYRASTGAAARVLLAAGATADVPSGPTRGTPLHKAARHGHDAVAEALLDHGADVDARDGNGQTPLRRAVNCRQLAVVRLLVRRGADPRAADRRGVTPLDAARTAEMKQALAGAER